MTAMHEYARVANDAAILLSGEGVSVAHFRLRVFAVQNEITEPFELAQAWIEHRAEYVERKLAFEYAV